MIPLQRIQNTRAACTHPDWPALMPDQTDQSRQLLCDSISLLLRYCVTPTRMSQLTHAQQAALKVYAIGWLVCRNHFKDATQADVARSLGVCQKTMNNAVRKAKQLCGGRR